MEINDTPSHGKGVFATIPYKAGDLVFILSGPIHDHPTRETIHIGNDRHIYDEYGKFINHSFVPTIRIEGERVVAATDIFIGDELCFNYNETELKMSSPFYVDDVLVGGKNE
jgi:SET domain-containing protein